MTPPPTGTPVWAWLLAVLGVAALSTVSTLVAQRPIRRAVSQVRDQVQNSHTDNLRDDLDAKFARVYESQDRLEAGQRRHDSEIASVRRENQLLHGDVARNAATTQDLAARLTRHIED